MDLSLIVARSINHVIGYQDGTLPWKIPEDMRHFKQMTTGSTVIMGNKTFLSIGRPLPNRTNIILKRERSPYTSDCFVTSVDEALEKAKETRQPTFVIGGAQIYDLFFPHVTSAYITTVPVVSPAGIQWSRPFRPPQWCLTESRSVKCTNATAIAIPSIGNETVQIPVDTINITRYDRR